MKMNTNTRSGLIDELKGMAIVAVVLFHLGVFKFGYLGVDVFYAIAGFLTAKSVAKRMAEGTFRYRVFLWDRIVRLWPLVLLAGIVSLVLGAVLMMPDDLDHMARSVAASNCFLNNILCYHSNSDYWATKNEYAPMLHFWYLGVLMQFYLVYPLVVRVGERVVKRNDVGIKILVALLSIASFAGWMTSPVPLHFYNMPFRFFEFGIGILAFYFGFEFPKWNLKVPLLATVGKASLSVYIWHYIIIAYARYALASEINVCFVVVYFLLLAGLSWLSYNLLEGRKWNVFLIAGMFAVSTGFSLWFYRNAGVFYDIPELDVKVAESRPGMHLAYCDRIYKCDSDFPDNGKVNVLVMGNSWARDWANVLWESSVSNRINLSYCFPKSKKDKEILIKRVHGADIIFTQSDQIFQEAAGKMIYKIGYKYFGPSNGFAYSRRFFSDYYDLSVRLPEGIRKKNDEDKKKYGDRLLDLIGPLLDEDDCMPVFSDDRKMISHDCYHLTEGGARYLAKRMENRIEKIVLSRENEN